MDRPLFEADHFVRFAGHKARIHLSAPLDGRRNFTGRLRGVRDGQCCAGKRGARIADSAGTH
ncbi:MAG: hypothetical protein R3F37_05785 [Candidatus Competibacteraceae bacterium]